MRHTTAYQHKKQIERTVAVTRRCRAMNENAPQEGLLVKAEPLQWAQEISQRMVDVVRVEDGALLLEANPECAAAINTVLVAKGVRVNELRKETTAGRLIA
jgi:hypothetical protein